MDIKVIDNRGLQEKIDVNPEILERMMALFSGDGFRFRKVFGAFVRKVLPFYLADATAQKRLPLDLFNDDANHNRLIISEDAFLIFDRKGRWCSAYYALPVLPGGPGHLYDTRPYKLKTLRLFLRMIMNSENDGIVLHASSMEDEGYGYVFIGPSGSGKSTVVKMLGPARILSDDTAIIRRINKAYQIFSNPWCNDDIQIKYPARPAALKAIFFIKQARNTSMKRLNHRESLARLIYSDWPFQQYGFFDNKAGIKNFYVFCQELTQRIPVFELKVRKSERFKQEFNGLLSKNLD